MTKFIHAPIASKPITPIVPMVKNHAIAEQAIDLG
jgi:hypothetical protein